MIILCSLWFFLLEPKKAQETGEGTFSRSTIIYSQKPTIPEVSAISSFSVVLSSGYNFSRE